MLQLPPSAARQGCRSLLGCRFPALSWPVMLPLLWGALSSCWLSWVFGAGAPKAMASTARRGPGLVGLGLWQFSPGIDARVK